MLLLQSFLYIIYIYNNLLITISDKNIYILNLTILHNATMTWGYIIICQQRQKIHSGQPRYCLTALLYATLFKSHTLCVSAKPIFYLYLNFKIRTFFRFILSEKPKGKFPPTQPLRCKFPALSAFLLLYIISGDNVTTTYDFGFFDETFLIWQNFILCS